MATNPKLEFYRFKLNHKDSNFKTFKDFAIDVLGGAISISNEEAFKLCFEKFMSAFHNNYAKDEKRKKAITVIEDPKLNKHLDKKPAFSSSKSIVYGVINGGSYGKERIAADIADKKDASTINDKKAVMLYYYIFAYFPPEHNEGFFMIHSNGSDETITTIFREYIVSLFKGGSYNKPIPEQYCPKSFQDDFKKDAIIKSMIFSTSVIDDTHTQNPISSLVKQYNIKIEIAPKNAKQKIAIKSAQQLYNFFADKFYSTGKKGIPLKEFSQTRLNTENEVSKAPKVFEWNTREHDFVPVVHLNGKVKMMADDTPDFIDLKRYCLELFENQILNELRADNNGTKNR